MYEKVVSFTREGLILMILKEKAINPNFKKRRFLMKMESEDNTLGPAGPPLQRGVLVVLQSVQNFLLFSLIISSLNDF